MAVNSRKKGHKYELDIRKFFEELGYDCAKTSRYASKMRDDQKVDLCMVDPWLAQCKAVEKLPKSYHALIKEMPDEEGMYRLLFHKKNRLGTLVTMELETFRELLEMLIANGVLKVR